MRIEEFVKILNTLASDLAVGDPNNKYKIFRLIYKGGQATVYVGQNRISKKMHAIKVYELSEYLESLSVHLQKWFVYPCTMRRQTFMALTSCYIM